MTSIKRDDVEVLALTMMAGSPTDEAAMKAGAVMIAQAARIAELEGAARKFTRFARKMEGRDDNEITSVGIELSQDETDKIKGDAIMAGLPADAFLSGRSTLCVSLDGLKVRHWRELAAALEGKK